MNKSLGSVIALVTGMFFLTNCNNGTSTASEKDSVATVETGSMTKDTMHNKMNMDTMNNTRNGLMSSMDNMMKKMGSMEMSGDFDIDFANMMIEHHQGAIDMSEAELKSGKDEKMKAMAQKIITMQMEEQGKLRDIVKSSKPMKMDMGKHDELTKDMDNMKDGMSKMQMTGNTDKDFAMMMISHHEGAVKMSKDELSHGMNPKLKQMAKKAIADQTKEINEFKSWMSANK